MQLLLINSVQKNLGLIISIFITGASVLIIEVTATRILSPYFGNTLFTVSSVLGVVLAALSVGYYVGGIVSDKYPSEKLFFYIILLSGFSVFFLKFLTFFLLHRLGYALSFISGPLISSIVLFFLPSFLLGMLSPFAIKLRQKNSSKNTIGKASGEVFFWSTLGSIVGSLSAGFILIPRFGVNQIIMGVGIVLIFLGLTGLFLSGVQNKKIIFPLIMLAGIFLQLQLFQENSPYLYSKDGIYERINIYDGKFKGRPTRFFQLDRSSSGAMFLDSDELVYDYSKYYVLYKLLSIRPQRALIIGGGAYSIPKAVINSLPQAKVDVVEIEPSLYDLAIQYFRLTETKRLKNFAEDGRRFLLKSHTDYDLIFADAYYSLFSVPIHFTTKEFFNLVKSKLSQDGIFILNFSGDLDKDTDSLTLSEIKTFRSVFSNSYFFAVDSPDSKKPQNIIFLGLPSVSKINFKDKKITTNKDPVIRGLKSKVIDISLINFDKYPLLTDDYAPVEYLTAQVLFQNFK